MTDREIWHRFEDQLVSNGADEWGDATGSHLVINHRTYTVTARTPKGVWLSWSFEDAKDRFVLNDAIKQFACPTIEGATASFIARKRKQADIHRKRAARAEEAIAILTATGFLRRRTP